MAIGETSLAKELSKRRNKILPNYRQFQIATKHSNPLCLGELAGKKGLLINPFCSRQERVNPLCLELVRQEGVNPLCLEELVGQKGGGG